MRILLLSDIHSNLEALEAALAAAAEYDVAVNLGDIVGYGASPNEVIARSRALGKLFVRGNHDKAAAGLMDLRDFNPVAGIAALWTRDALTPENLDWLRSLPQGPIHLPEAPELEFVHGSPLDEDEYLVTMNDAAAPLASSRVPVTFFGHSHIQGGFSRNGASDDVLHVLYPSPDRSETCQVQLKKGIYYLINPGSIGQPRDGDWRTAFALFDSGSWAVTFYRVPYNLKQAQQRIISANLPARLAARLESGR